MLAKTTMDKHAANQKTLPDDLHFEFNHIMKLFLKTKLMVRSPSGIYVADRIWSFEQLTSLSIWAEICSIYYLLSQCAG